MTVNIKPRCERSFMKHVIESSSSTSLYTISGLTTKLRAGSFPYFFLLVPFKWISVSLERGLHTNNNAVGQRFDGFMMFSLPLKCSQWAFIADA